MLCRLGAGIPVLRCRPPTASCALQRLVSNVNDTGGSDRDTREQQDADPDAATALRTQQIRFGQHLQKLKLRGHWREVHPAFRLAAKRKLPVNQFHYSAAIAIFGKCHKSLYSEQMFQSMLLKGIQPDVGVWNALLDA